MYEPFACTASVTWNEDKSTCHEFHEKYAYLLPSSDLLVVPDAGHVRVAAGLLGDERALGDKERPRSAGTLRIKRRKDFGDQDVDNSMIMAHLINVSTYNPASALRILMNVKSDFP